MVYPLWFLSFEHDLRAKFLFISQPTGPALTARLRGRNRLMDFLVMKKTSWSSVTRKRHVWVCWQEQ